MSDAEVDDFLAHYGVKGMRWGHRKDGPSGVSPRTNREASKDAREYARAKMFYGEGAGTRRKLIKAKVEAKSAKDPKYKKAFDHHMARQDLGKHGEKARGERRRKDVKNSTAKTARGVKNVLLNTGAPVTITALGVAAAIQNPVIRDFTTTNAKKGYSYAAKAVKKRTQGGGW